MNLSSNLSENGFAFVENCYSSNDIQGLSKLISDYSECSEQEDQHSVYAIRNFLQKVPEAAEIVFNSRLKAILNGIFKRPYFVVKSIYFDKPEGANWFVSWHQDLSIAVRNKVETEGYKGWTVKANTYSVQPPDAVLQNVCTVRIHLDDTTNENGALKVIPGSHLSGRINDIAKAVEITGSAVCEVKRGGVMLMKPLILHASSRSVNGAQRRVIHIEFSDQNLPDGLTWAEQAWINNDKLP